MAEVSATFEPLKFDGHPDKASLYLQFCFAGGRYGRMPQEILDAISSWHPTQRLELLATWDTRGPSPKVEEYMIRTRNFEPRNLPVEVGWLSLTGLPEEGVTRVGMRPLLMAEEPMKVLWDWLRETLNEQGLLVDEVQQKQPDGKLPKKWPKTTTKQVEWRSLYPKIRLLAAQGNNATEIARRIKGLDRRDVPHILKWGKWDKSQRRR